jgi:hypothetical protein
MIAFDETPEGAWPTTLAELAPAERLVLWSLRRWIAGWVEENPSQWSLVSSEFAHIFGARDGRATLSSFAKFFKALWLAAGRTIRHHHPCCPLFGEDEACLLVLLAACRRGDWRLARAAGRWLTDTSEVGDLIGCAADLAAALAAHGMDFPHRTRTPAYAAGSAAGITVLH